MNPRESERSGPGWMACAVPLGRAEGLGVGSPLAAFDTAYGKGEAVGEEGNSVRYWPPDGGGHFFVDVSGGCYGMVGRRWVVDRACRATDISFIVLARP